MEILTKLINALWIQDFETLSNPSIISMLYLLLFVILFLENGFLPAAFLPGDSLLVLVGVLCAKEIMSFLPTVLLLTTAASFGCWISYIQGKWLGNTEIIQSWLSYLPNHYHQRAHSLFKKYGLSALIIVKFIAFIRTLLPTIAGLSKLDNIKFQCFNWISSFIWVIILVTFGYLLGKTSIFIRYEDQLIYCLLILPILLVIIGFFGSVLFLWKKNIVQRKTKIKHIKYIKQKK